MCSVYNACKLKTLVLATAVAKPDENVDADGRERLGRALQDAICDHTA